MVGPVWLLIIAIIITGWLILGYLLIARPPQRFMSKGHRWLLLFCIGLTASLWRLDSDPPCDNSIWETLTEIPIVGTMYCALFFFTFAGIGKLARLFSR